MNAAGIVVMYASLSESAALVEASGGHTDLSLATFELLQAVKIVDLTQIPVPPSIFEDGPRESLQFLRSFAKDVSQPFAPDTQIHIDYAPTQVVSEFIRHRLKAEDGKAIQGFLYDSAKENGSSNLALFISSEDVEGVAAASWKKPKPVVRLLSVVEKTS